MTHGWLGEETGDARKEPFFDAQAVHESWKLAKQLIEVRTRAESRGDFQGYEEGALSEVVSAMEGQEQVPDIVQKRMALHIDAVAFLTSSLIWIAAEAVEEISSAPAETTVALLLGSLEEQLKLAYAELSQVG